MKKFLVLMASICLLSACGRQTDPGSNHELTS